MRRWTCAMVALALVAGCAARGRPAGGPEPAPVTPPPAPPPADGGAPARPALHRLTLPPGQAIDRPGLFFLRVDTGAMEGWTLDGPADYIPSPDNRWVQAERWDTHTVYLVDRKAGAEFTWNAGERRLLAAEGDHLLFADQNRVWLTDANLHVVAALPARPAAPSGVFSRDGQWLAVANGPVVYLVATATGTVRELTRFAPDTVGYAGVNRLRGGEEIVVYAPLLAPGGAASGRVLTRRYTWQGELVGEITTAGALRFALSPDGRYLARSDRLAGVVPVAVIEAMRPAGPGLRLKAGAFCDPVTGRGFGPTWLADSSGVAVYTDSGYRILTTDGLLLSTPGGGSAAARELVPAPDRADRFAVDGTVVTDGTGRVLRAVALAPGLGAGAIEPWGTASDELRITPSGGGSDGRCEFPTLPPQVDRPPYADAATLTIGAQAAGDCVRLRREPGRQGKVVACLAGGRRVTLTDPPGPTREGVVQRAHNGAYGDGMYWLYVLSDGGEQGWLAAGAAGLTWAG